MGRPDALNQCPLLGVKRTFSQLTLMSVIDPKRTCSTGKNRGRIGLTGLQVRSITIENSVLTVSMIGRGVGRGYVILSLQSADAVSVCRPAANVGSNIYFNDLVRAASGKVQRF